MSHHNLGSSRATPSHLGSFTSKSNKYHKDCLTKIKCSIDHKEDSLNPPLRFSHKSQDPHKEELGRAHKGLGWVYFVGGTSTLQRREGESFYTCPPKTSHWKLASKNWNIRYLKSSRWSSSAQTGPSGFFWFSEMWSVCYHYISLISLGYLGFCWAWDFVDNLRSIPFDRASYIYSRLNIKYISSTWPCTRWLLPLQLFLTSWGLPHLILFWHWLLGGCDLVYFKPYNQFPHLISISLYILIQ
jgi:hypothetical protein